MYHLIGPLLSLKLQLRHYSDDCHGPLASDLCQLGRQMLHFCVWILDVVWMEGWRVRITSLKINKQVSFNHCGWWRNQLSYLDACMEIFQSLRLRLRVEIWTNAWASHRKIWEALKMRWIQWDAFEKACTCSCSTHTTTWELFNLRPTNNHSKFRF